MTHNTRSLVATISAVLLLAAATAVSAQRGQSQRADDPQRPWGEVGITIFSEANFRGMNANFRDDVPDLRRYNMNDRVDSIAIGRGETWQLCENINYGGRCQVFSGDETDLARVGWGGMVSSFRRLRDDRGRGGFGDQGRMGGDQGRMGGPFSRSRLVLFDHVFFSGQSYVLTEAQPILHALDNRAGSAKAYGGAWEICDGPRFSGRCVIIDGNQPDLGREMLRDRVSSARPVQGRGGR